MGSLAAVFSSSGRPAADNVARMLAAAPHRGDATRVVGCGPVALGVAIGAATDAWVAEENGAAAAFCGVLDNAAELSAALGRDRPAAPDANPAEVLLRAYETWGEGAVPRLRGVFAAAIAAGSKLVLLRDQIGFGTLFFRDGDEGVVAASEAKQVAAGAGLSRQPDLEALDDIFYGRLGERRTALRGVERLPRASTAVVGTGVPLAIRRYWDPSDLLETADVSVDEACERMVDLLDRAVARCVTGEDAVSLSGGLDSPSVAALAAPHHLARAGRPLHAFSAVFPEQPSVDERGWVELISGRLGLPLETYVPRAGPLDDVGHWVDLTDGPIDTHSVPEAAEAYRVARGLGARTVLTGELAEYVLTVDAHLPGHLALHGRWRPLARWARAHRGRGRSSWAVARMLAPAMTPAPLAGAYTRARRREHRPLPPWIDPAEVGGLGRRRDLERPARRRWLDAQLEPLRGAAITIEADAICAESVGVQVRRPFADVDLWEFFLSLRAETKFPDLVTKSLLRRAMGGRLPHEVLYRRDKTAFDDHLLATADYAALRRWIFDGGHRVHGVDYDVLRSRLEAGGLGVLELMWACDLARVHAFARSCA